MLGSEKYANFLVQKIHAVKMACNEKPAKVSHDRHDYKHMHMTRTSNYNMLLSPDVYTINTTNTFNIILILFFVFQSIIDTICRRYLCSHTQLIGILIFINDYTIIGVVLNAA